MLVAVLGPKPRTSHENFTRIRRFCEGSADFQARLAMPDYGFPFLGFKGYVVVPLT